MKKLCLSIFMMLLSGVVYCQEMPKIIPPSPSVAGLMKLDDVSVSNYTGQPNISIPFISAKASNDFSINIGMSYSSSGVKIDERSSPLGTGWTLTGEAVISRTVMGIADEFDNRSTNGDAQGKKRVGVYHNGFFDLGWNFSPDNAIDYNSNEQDFSIQKFLWNSSGKGSGRFDGDYDKEMDIYHFNIFGKTGRFLITKDDGVLVPKMILNESNLKIELSYDVNTYEIDYFEVIDTNGLKYRLSEKETDITGANNLYKYQNSINDAFDGSGFSDREEIEHISAWKVVEVKNFNNDVYANFEYLNALEKFKLPNSLTTTSVDESFGNSHTGPYNYFFVDTLGSRSSVVGYNNSIVKPAWSKSLIDKELIAKKISKISFTIKNEEILFNYIGSHPEYDENTGVKLNSITHKKSGNEIKKIEFTINPNPFNRLFLDSYTETFNSTSTNNYNLIYDRKELLYGYEGGLSDDWGYYKADQSHLRSIYRTPSLISDRENITIGTLKNIEYPTGGVKEFEFESHDFAYSGKTVFSDSDFRNFNPDNWTEGYKNELFEDETSQGANGGKSQNYLEFNLNEAQTILLRPQVETGTDFLNTKFVLYKVNESGVEELIVNSASTTVNSTHHLIKGDYRIYFINFYSGDRNIKILLNLHFKEFKPDIIRLIPGGGLRIGKIIFKDSINSEVASKELEYLYNYRISNTLFSAGISFQNSNLLDISDSYGLDDARDLFLNSSGVIDGFFTRKRNYSLNINYTLGGLVTTTSIGVGSGNQPGNIFSPMSTFDVERIVVEVPFNITQILQNPYIELTQGSNVGYARVFVLEKQNGYSLLDHTTAKDFPTYTEGYTYPFKPRTNKAYLHGLIKSQKIINQNQDVLKSEDYVYHDPIEIEVDKYLFSYDNVICPDIQFYSTLDDFKIHLPSQGRNFIGDNPASQELYNNCTNGDVAPVYYNFIPHTFSKYLLKEKVTKDYFYEGTDSNVVVSLQEYKYNDNYLVNETLSTINNGKSIINKVTYPGDTFPELFPSSSSPTLGLNDQSYSNLIHQNKITTPVLELTYQEQNNVSDLISSVRKTFTNDNFTRPYKIQVAKGEVSSLDDFEDRIIYHEYDDLGNPLEVSKKDGTHVVYIWGYNKSQPVAKIENATYSEVSSFVSNIQNASNLDLDRTVDTYDSNGTLIPQGAEGLLRQALNGLRINNSEMPNKWQVTTFTYDPLIGVTSITDPRGETIYYDYDGFNRLRSVKDKDGNILSENQYNYKN